MKRFIYTLIVVSSVVGCNKTAPPGEMRSTSNNGMTSATHEVKKDNTAINERDRSDAAKTPIDQNENQKDIDITASIRKQVVDKKMSTNAENSKIITQDGKVTLRGPVKSEEEKKQIVDIAVSVAGDGNVTNQLEVQP